MSRPFAGDSRESRESDSLGIAGFAYTDADCTGQLIRRVHVTELQERVR